MPEAASLPRTDPMADEAFFLGLQANGMPAHGPFTGEYVEWEWRRVRHLFLELPFQLADREVLEFGCHLGATAIVLALMGARVTAVDVDPAMLSLAGLNARRYGVADRIRFQPLADSRALPLSDAAYDVVVCNSVLEYVRPDWLLATEKELDRVLRPSGIAVILGTSNRLWPREVHSGQWFSNYLPRALDPLVPWRLRRGVSQWSLKEGFEDYDDLLTTDASKWIRLKQSMGLSGWKLSLLQRMVPAAQSLGLSPSALMPTLTMLLRKPARG